MRMYDVIDKKKRGMELDESEIRFFVNGYVDGSIPDYQMSALLMAIWFSGMTVAETATLSEAMANSGEVIDLSAIRGVPVDKHSTGGVADSTSLIVAPVVAACGGYIAKITGRGLGHTGGTLDKLESIPGMRVDLTAAEFTETVNRYGLSIVGQTGNLVPADKKLYALRDVTSTVDAVPLIASSIMSKKLASGAEGIVLDVKHGSGSFIKRADDAVELAELMTAIGARDGRRIVALVTDMNQPLGTAVGNALDVAEVIRVLKGEGGGGEHGRTADLVSVSVALAAELLVLSGLHNNVEEAASKAARAIESGDAMTKFGEMIEAQHGDPRVVDDVSRMPRARSELSVVSETNGVVTAVDAASIGSAAQLLGAGRSRKGDSVDPAVGIEVMFRLGDDIAAGEELYRLHVNDKSYLDAAKARCLNAVSFGPEAPRTSTLIYRRISGGEKMG